MSWQAMKAVNEQSRIERMTLFRLLMYFADKADADGRIDPAPNQTTLAEKFACSERTIRNRLNQICDAGELNQTRVGSGPGNPSAYQITLPMPESKPEDDAKGGRKAEENAGFVSAFKEQMAEVKAEILELKAEILELKAEKAETKGGKGGNERRKAHSFENADDPIDPNTIQEEGERAPAREELSPQLRQLKVMADTLVEITGMDGKLNERPLILLAQELLLAYTADQVQTHYAQTAEPNGHWNWYLHDWRGQRGERPTPRAIRETIKTAVSGELPAQRAPASSRASPTRQREPVLIDDYQPAEDGTW